jgi:hypothetical protein
MTSCAAAPSATSTVASKAAHPATPAATPLGQSDTPAAQTAMGVVEALNAAGLPAPDPLGTTWQDCPDIGSQSVVTDTVRVEFFPTVAWAQRYRFAGVGTR